MAFSFELGLAISAERYGAISAGPEHLFPVSTWFCFTNVPNLFIMAIKYNIERLLPMILSSQFSDSPGAFCWNPVISVVRVVSMLMIIGCHLASWFNIAALAQLLNVGVPIFFFISGLLYAGKEIPDGWRFIKQRWLKLCIPMYLLLVFVVVIELLRTRNWDELQAIPVYLLNLQGIQWIFGTLSPYQLDGLGPLWFLTVIMCCYILLALVKKLEHFQTSPVPAASVFLGLIVLDVLLTYTIKVNLSYFIIFFIGYYLGGHRKKMTAGKYGLFSLIMVVCMVFRLISRNLADGTVLYNNLVVPYTHMVLAVWIYQTFVMLSELSPNWFSVMAKSPVIAWLDKMSMYFYMTHYLFLFGSLSVDHLLFSKSVLLLVFIGETLLSALLLHWATAKLYYRLHRKRQT